jgi:hypothetical protein
LANLRRREDARQALTEAAAELRHGSKDGTTESKKHAGVEIAVLKTSFEK